MSDIQPANQLKPLVRQRGLGLRDVIYVVFRRKWIIAAITIPIMLVASLGFFRQKGSFIAASRVLIELRSPEITTWNPTSAHIDEDRVLNTYEHMAMSVPVAAKAAELLADSLQTVIQRKPDLSFLNGKNRRTSFLLHNLDVSQVGESNIFEITFGSPDPDLSLMAVRACRDAFLEYHIHAGKNLEAMDYYDEQVQRVRADVDSLLALRSDIVLAAGYTSLRDDLRYDSGQVSNLEYDYFQAASARRFLESKVESFRAAQARDPDFFPVSDRGLESSPVIDAKKRLDEQQSKLNELLVEHPENSVQVQQQKDVLARTQEMYHKALEDFIRGSEIELEAARQREFAIKEQMDNLQQSLHSAPDIYRQASLIDAELAAKRSLMEDLQVKSGEVRLNEMADERVSRIIKLTEPEIDRVITGGHMLAYFVIVSVFGFLFSIVVAFTVDRQDRKIYSAHAIEEYLEVPVLGVITEGKQEKLP